MTEAELAQFIGVYAVTNHIYLLLLLNLRASSGQDLFAGPDHSRSDSFRS